MSMDLKILEILACPQCRGKLKLETESLFCSACLLEYPIRNGIPVLLIESAKKRG